MPFPALRRFVPLSVALALTACVDLTGLNDIFGTPLLGIAVDAGIVEVGDTVRISAAGDVGGIIGIFSYDPILDARWAISDKAIAQLVPLPLPPPEDSFPRARTLIRGIRQGSAQVTATARGVSGVSTVRVIPMINAIHLIPPRDTLAVGDTIRVRAGAYDIGDVPINDVPLTFSVGGGIELRGFDNAGARIVAIAAGPATVTARFRRASGATALIVVPRAP